MKKSILFLVVVGFLQNPFMGYSQDSIPVTSNIKEEKFLKFQDYFFKALAQKSIYNYRVAIQNLEKCNELEPKNISVLFELSKNYLMLKKIFEAEEFAKQALALEPNNYWVLKHITTVYIASRNIKKAIRSQEKLAKIQSKERERLVFLYYQNNELNKVKQIIADLENTHQLTPALSRFKNRIIKPTQTKNRKKVVGLSGLIKEFETNKSFDTLYKILTLSQNSDNNVLLTYSEIGLELFPAQAFVYLMNAKALNKTKKYKRAIDQLINGIDFVIDNNELEARFYDEFAFSYKELGDNASAIKNKNKALALRKK